MLPGRKSGPDPVAIAAAVVTAAASALRAGRAFARGFDPDEFQHLHGGWSLAHGLWPYRDYFEHHTPWLHLAMVPFFSLVDVDRDPGDAVAFVFLARGAMWVMATLALVLTFRLGQQWAGTRAGWVGAALLSVTMTFAEKAVEIRPDVPVMVCLLGSWLMLLGALRLDLARGARWRLFASGALFGAAILFTQKALFAGPGAAIVLLWWALDPRPARRLSGRVAGLVAFGAGSLAPIALTLAVFAPHTGIGAFVDSNFMLNARWPIRFSPMPAMRGLVEDNPALAVLALAGLARTVSRLAAPAAVTRGDALVVVQAVALVVGAFVIPTPQPQYFLMVLPLVALLAARALIEAAEAAAALMPGRGASWPAASVCAVAGLLVAAEPPLASLARAQHPVRPKVQDQLGRMRLVLTTTAPDETVMDGFTGAGAFRPHAYYYFFLHEEIRALLGAAHIARLRGELRDGEIAPAVVLFDDDLRALPGEITSFLRENYQPSGDALVWRRKDLALDGPRVRGRLDIGSGATDVLVGRGWSDPVEEDGRFVRYTQGRRSTLRVPLREAADLVLTVRARPDHGEGASPGHLGVTINDTPVGELVVSPDWKDYVFHVPAARWRMGVNRVRLTCGRRGRAPPDAAEGASAGAPIAMAVDYLEVRPPDP